MKIAVCEDESTIRNELVQMIQREQPDAEVIAFSSAEALLIAQTEFMIYFLDIRLSGMSGIALAKALRKEQTQPKSIIIFVTGYREYMEDAFDVNAYHYLVKPIDGAKFRRIFRRAWAEAAALAQRMERQILIKEGGVSKAMFLREIYYIESSNKKVVFHTKEGSFAVYGKMEAWEAELGDSFYRCHRCYLVNLEKIAAYSSDTIRLVNDETLLLAQKKYADFVKAFLRYAKRGGVVNV